MFRIKKDAAAIWAKASVITRIFFLETLLISAIKGYVLHMLTNASIAGDNIQSTT
ncbi:hypothetical protein [Flavobacterium micromati]|uniref:hypothetical protein n=1 Tax=Flavobacterium micromati TaxID=229205 RepID=UPI0014816E7C|nr:hypothetical protein [Flavobacterium micromati]